VASLRASIEREATATEMALTPAPLEDAPGSGLPGRDELCRQLAALRGRAARAPSGTRDQHELRAELATLLFFANTLRSDAQAWRAGLRQAVEELERKEATARRERERVAAERAELVRRRDALQIQIDREAGRMARRKGGECRRTVPVITLRPGFTVSSMTVSSSRRRFRSLKLWLVTLDERHGVLVIRD
jgi:hypothetical protein